MSLLTALAIFGTLGTTELIIILVILLLIFGASKLPQLGGAMGKTIKSFKAEMKDGMGEIPKDSAVRAETRFCAKCGCEVKDSEAGYCPKCGKALA
jgi:sec-independent protein translocase protein TatA